MAFSLAEALENKKDTFEEIQTIFESLIKRLDDGYIEMNLHFDAQRDALFAILKQSIIVEAEDEDEGERRERDRETAKEHEKEVHSRVEVAREREKESRRRSASLAWIVYMRLTRRSKSIRAARIVFGRARKSALVTSHVFTASGTDWLI